MSPTDLAQMGFHLFPCKGKRPLVKWSAESTTDLPTINSWAARYPNCNWAVDCGKSNLTVLDDDRGKNPAAVDSLLDLEFEHGALPATFTVRTVSGGYHYYYHGQGRNSASSKLGKGLDSRGAGGYVIAPCTPDYTVTNDAPIATAPAWLIDLLGKPLERDPQEVPSNVILDMEFAVNRAIDYLTTVEPAIEGDGGDAHTYRVACRVRDFGISQDKCLELMETYWNDRCQPPWGDDLVDKVFNAYRYAENPVGTESPEAVFAIFDDGTATPISSMFIEVNELLKREIRINYLIHGLIETPSTGLIFGDPSAGKSFLAIDMALAVACGHSWMGAMCRQGVSVYFAGEGRQGVQRRMAAWRKHHNIVIPDNHLWVSERRIEFGSKSVKAIADDLKRIQDIAGLPISLCHIDTLARHMPAAGDENSAKDMGNFVNMADWLRDQFEAVVAIVHHSGKMNKDSSRGSSAIRGAMDWEFRVENKEGLRGVQFTKQKESELPMPMGFDLRQVDLGDGTLSAVPVRCDYDPTGGKCSNLSSDALLVLNLIKFGTSENRVTFLQKSALRREFYESIGEGVGDDTKRKKFRRAMDKLLENGTITIEGDRIYDNSLDVAESED